MNRTAFESTLKKLLHDWSSLRPNTHCIACEDCEGCGGSTFCKRSTSLSYCHYCVETHNSTHSSHLVRSKNCHRTSHCVECDGCIDSAYLTRSIGCRGCTYCFGCVGLTQKDFHILNRPYDRQSYFELVAELSRELALSSSV